MTSIVAVIRKDSIWLAADRRLTGKDGPLKDDAVKIILMETTDGKALLGYAGLGATALGTEPSNWMHAVLRGRNLPLENSLGVLANAIQDQIPRHLVQVPKDQTAAHVVVVPAFLNDKPTLYWINLVFAGDRKNYRFQYERVRVNQYEGAAPAIIVAGSGSFHVASRRGDLRAIMSLASAHDRKRINSRVVARRLAELNASVHAGEPTVGERCIVAWSGREGGFRKGGGGLHYFTGSTEEHSSPSLPSIVNGMNLSGIVEVLAKISMPKLQKSLETGEKPEMDDTAELNAAIRNVPHKPDSKLR